MGRTNAKKQEARDARLKKLPTSERLVKSALIKKKEGRVLDASEKHALKMTSEHGEILRLWEQLRVTEGSSANKGESEAQSTAEEKRSAYEGKYPVVEKLLKLIEPKFASFVRTPSISRAVQSMIKYGSAQHVERILRLLSADFTTFSTDAYAHFVVCALIRHAPHDVYKKLLTQVIPAVPQLVSHKFGIEVVHAVYSSRWSSPMDRNLILLSIFKENVSVMKRWEGYPVFEDVVKGNAALKKRLLTRLFDLADKLVSQKEAVGFPFVQRMIHTYMCNGMRDEVSELCDTLGPHLAAIATSREGAPLASLSFSLTEPKKRKEILRSFTDILGALSTSKYGAPVVARLFDLLYDVQLLNKYVLNGIVEHIGQVVNSPYGYQILMHLLTPHDARKRKFLLPNWFEHNLFSMENKEWNHHTWLTANFEPEVVEICSKPAVTSHLAALPTFVNAFVKYTQDPLNADKLNRHNTALIAREIVTVIATEPHFKAALNLPAQVIAKLESMAPAQGAGALTSTTKTSSQETHNTKKKKVVSGEAATAKSVVASATKGSNAASGKKAAKKSSPTGSGKVIKAKKKSK